MFQFIHIFDIYISSDFDTIQKGDRSSLTQ